METVKISQPIGTELYTYSVVWSAEDEEFVGTCAEFPSLSWLDQLQSEALVGIFDLVAEVIEDLKKTGEDSPHPFLR